MPLNFALSIAGTHEDGARSNAMSQLDMAVPVADNKGAAKSQAVLTGGALQHSRLRLAAGAAIVSFVRTIVQRVDMRSLFGKLGCHEIVNGVNERVRKISANDAGLIGDDDGRIFRIVQPPDGRGGEGKHTKTAGVSQVTDFFGDGSVAIEEDGGTKGGSFSQTPPPQSEANQSRPLRPLQDARVSCNDDQSDSAAGNRGCSTAFLAPRCIAERSELCRKDPSVRRSQQPASRLRPQHASRRNRCRQIIGSERGAQGARQWRRLPPTHSSP